MKLDEQTQRLPDFQPGVLVTLADGQAWHFRSPRISFNPEPDGQGGYRFGRRQAWLGPQFTELLDQALTDPDNIPMNSLLMLGILALRLNYDLTDEQAFSLLKFELDSEENQQMWSHIAGAATGFYKGKPSATG